MFSETNFSIKAITVVKLIYKQTKTITLTSKIEKLLSIQRRASSIVNIHGACLLVKKCLDGLTCQNFQNYFKSNTHDFRKRNQGKLLIVPDVRLGTTQSTFFFMGARVFNSLPLEIRRWMSSLPFGRRLIAFLSSF